MSRGREANTAHVTTVTGVDDPGQDRDDHTLHRDPAAALAAVLETTKQAAARVATAWSTDEAGSVRTAGSRPKSVAVTVRMGR